MSYELISDLYKDAIGVRPDAAFFDAFNAQNETDKAAQWTHLCDMLTQREADDRSVESDARLVFNNRLAGMMADYSIDMATALKWDMDAFCGTSLTAIVPELRAQEIEHYLWKQGIAFDQFKFYVDIMVASWLN
jgi:hypothetical protein